MLITNVINACILSEKFDYDLPIYEKFTNYKIDDKLLEKRDSLLNKHCFTDKQTINELAKTMKCQIFYQKNNYFMESENFGPGVFIKEAWYGYHFHTNRGKVFVLPTGLNYTKKSFFRVTDIFDISSSKFVDYFIEHNILRLKDQIDNLEEKLDVGFEIWTRSRNDGKLKFELKRRSKLNIKKLFHVHSDLNILFLITDTKLYFRGHLRELKIHSI